MARESYQREQERIAEAMREFSGEFGLRAFPGKRFRVADKLAHFVSEGYVQLVVEILNGDQWQQFGRDRIEVLRGERTKLEQPVEAPKVLELDASEIENALVIHMTVSDQLLKDLLVTAVEGGSNYWAAFGEINRDEQLNIRSVLVTEHEPGGAIVVSKTVTPRDLVKGLQLLAGNKRKDFTNAEPCLMRCIREDYDQTDADIVLQMTVFGELVYG
jgi:hypothetical protein